MIVSLAAAREMSVNAAVDAAELDSASAWKICFYLTQTGFGKTLAKHRSIQGFRQQSIRRVRLICK